MSDWLDDVVQDNNGLPRDHLSFSAINTYLTCPARYYFRYEQGLKIPPKAALTFGKCTHSTIEYNYRHKIETEEDLPVSEVKEYFAAEMDKARDETDWDEDPNQLKDEGIRIVELYHTEVAKEIMPVAVEERVEIPVAGVNFLGFIDLIDQHGNIRDTKTSKRTPSQQTIDKSLQVTGYSFAYRIINQQPENGIVFDYLIRNKIPKIVHLPTERTDADRVRFERLVGRVVDAIQKKVYYPNPTHYGCSPEYCGYWHECAKVF